MYILECNGGSYYTGSTTRLDLRMWQHDHFLGANHTRKYHPCKLAYVEEFDRIDKAFYREKQVQRWTHAKKKALIEGASNALHALAECRNETHYKNGPFDSAQGPV
jgi:putative endonuclease